MNESAYKFLKPGSENYETIKNSISNLVNSWNSTHSFSKVNIQTIAELINRILIYNKWITIKDLKIVFEKGLIGEYGVYNNLGADVIFRWFQIEREKKSKSIRYQTNQSGSNFISEEQKRQTRKELIETFLGIYRNLKETNEFPDNFSHYSRIFYSWLEKIGVMKFDDDRMKKERNSAMKIVEAESKPGLVRMKVETIEEKIINRVQTKLLKERLRELISLDYDLEAELNQLKI